MKDIDDESIDMIFCDLPYGTTKNKWDIIISPEKLWPEYERIIKRNGAIVLFGQDKFTAQMMLSNERLHRYNLIWQKTTPTGFLNAKKMPLRSHEDIIVFYKALPTYNPQKSQGHTPVHSYTKHTSDGTNYGKTLLGISGGGSTERHPTSIWKFSTDKQKGSLHPNQKPLDLCKCVIRTYTNTGDTVLDNTCGYGTIPLAAAMEERNYIGMDDGVCEKENSEHFGRPWAELATERIESEIKHEAI